MDESGVDRASQTTQGEQNEWNELLTSDEFAQLALTATKQAEGAGESHDWAAAYWAKANTYASLAVFTALKEQQPPRVEPPA